MMALFLAAACNDGWDDQVGAAAHIEAQLAMEPNTPVAVPREIPDGYRFSGISTFQKGRGGTVVAASWRYDSIEEEPSLPVVELCLQVERFDVRDLCTPAGHRIERVALRGLTVTIVPMGPGPDEAALERWVQTDFTLGWRDVEWVTD